MAPHTLDFNCALITGGGGGLGRAMAEWLVSNGKKVIIAGRTESNLQSTAEELGRAWTPYYILDTGDSHSIPGFLKKLISEHPEVDCLINNAGVQRPLEIDVNNVSAASDVLQKANQEIAINISGPMHLTMLMLPHLKTKKSAVIMNITSVLGYIPFSIINPVYNGTKAWLHFWTMNLRTQLQASDDGKHIKVVEVAPPMVETDLHRERSDPDDNKKEKNSAALSIEDFMKGVVEGWKQDKDTVSAGMGNGVVERWQGTFGEDYQKSADAFIK